MACTDAAPDREYVVSLSACFVVYFALIVAAEWNESAGLIARPWLYLLAVAPAAPVSGMLLAVLRLMTRSDEFVRSLLAKRFVLAAGIVFALGTAWGFLEMYAGVPDFPLYLILPAFWAAFGLVSPLVRTTR